MSYNNGGELQNNIFEKILSIGYELESKSVSKLTLLDFLEGNVLMNSDTISADLPDIQDDYLLQFEHTEFDVYTSDSVFTNRKKKDENSKFLVLNDMADSKFIRYLKKLCEEQMQEKILANDDDEKTENEIIKEFKNKLYTFETLDDKIYHINFEHKINTNCGTFADTEWIFTYFNPKKSGSIILDTFTNVIKNMVEHTNNLEQIRGKLFINYGPYDKKAIPNPRERILFHYPNTNLYYLQNSHVNEQQTPNDICISPQMTFSCNIQDVILISKELIRDTLNTYGNDEVIDYYLKTIEKIENCVNELLQSFNSTAKKPIEGYRADIIKNYIFLILFKLYSYYNSYLLDEGVINDAPNKRYLKDYLFINSRHSNNQLYKYLKIAVVTYFNITDKRAAEIIQKIIVQSSILEKYMNEENEVKGKPVLRKGVFQSKNILDKTNKQYGNPTYSLISYFHFFENPPKDVVVNDWFYTSGHTLTADMDIKNNIILIELRCFRRILNLLIGSVSDDSLQHEITNGACNRIHNNFLPTLNVFTLSALKQFADFYESNPSMRTARKMRFRSKTTKKTARTARKTVKSKSKSKSKSLSAAKSA